MAQLVVSNLVQLQQARIEQQKYVYRPEALSILETQPDANSNLVTQIKQAKNQQQKCVYGREALSILETQPDALSILETQPDAHSILETQPDANSIIETQPDANSILVTQPDAHSILETQPDAHGILETQPDANGILETQPDANSILVTQPAANSILVTQPAANSILVTQLLQAGKEQQKYVFYRPEASDNGGERHRNKKVRKMRVGTRPSAHDGHGRNCKLRGNCTQRGMRINELIVTDSNCEINSVASDSVKLRYCDTSYEVQIVDDIEEMTKRVTEDPNNGSTDRSSIKSTVKFSYRDGTFDEHEFFSIPVIKVVWPSAQFEEKCVQFWTPEIVNEIVSNGCHAVVLTGNSNKTDPPQEVDCFISFAAAETKLIQTLPKSLIEVYEAYVVLLQHCIEEDMLDTLKVSIRQVTRTVFFRTCERMGHMKFDTTVKWSSDKAVRIILLLLIETCDVFYQRRLPHYFLEEFNLLAGESDANLGRIASRLGNVPKGLDEFLRQTLIQCYGIHEFLEQNADEYEIMNYLVNQGFTNYGKACSHDTQALHAHLKQVHVLHEKKPHSMAGVEMIDLISLSLNTSKTFFKLSVQKPDSEENGKKLFVVTSLTRSCELVLQTKLNTYRIRSLYPAYLIGKNIVSEINRALEYSRGRESRNRETWAKRTIEAGLSLAMIYGCFGNMQLAQEHIEHLTFALMQCEISPRTASKLLTEQAKIQLVGGLIEDAHVNLLHASHLDNLNADAILYLCLAENKYPLARKANGIRSENAQYQHHENESLSPSDHAAQFVRGLPIKNGKAPVYLYFITKSDFCLLERTLLAEIQYLMGMGIDDSSHKIINSYSSQGCLITRVPVPARVLIPYLVLLKVEDPVLERRCLDILEDAAQTAPRKCAYVAHALLGHALSRHTHESSCSAAAAKCFSNAMNSFDGKGSVLVKTRLKNFARSPNHN